jgi:hypothetical protein
MLPTDEKQQNLTLTVNYQGNETYNPSIMDYYCTYHRERGWHLDGHTDFGCGFLFIGFIYVVLFAIVGIVIYYSIGGFKKDFQSYEE